jgi:hypothetical protein
MLATVLPANPRPIGFRGATAIFCALLSTCALPWSGAAVFYFIGVRSWVWFPLFSAAIIVAPADDAGFFRTFRARAVFLGCLVVASAAFCRFISLFGTPGDFLSIEGFSMILRLEGLRGPVLYVAMALIFSGLLMSFAPAVSSVSLVSGGASSNLAAFSCVGFLALVFVPFSSSELLCVKPPYSSLADAGLPLAVSLCARPLPIWLSSRLPSSHSRVQVAAPIVFTAAGCILLLASQ